MAVDATITLETLHCIREKDEHGHSEPYIWPALVFVDGQTNVHVTSLHVESARVVIQSNMRPGDIADIPSSVGRMSVRLDDGARALILVVALLEADDGPVNGMEAGILEYPVALRDALAEHLLDLSTADDVTRAAIIAEIKASVTERVLTAFENALDPVQKLAIGALTLDPDDILDSDFLNFPIPLVSTPLRLAFGPDQGGRLLFYRDVNQDGTGDVANPSVIGQGGWQAMKFLFSGGNGILYAVDQEGQLLFYRDTHQDGTGDVANPSIIGQGGWQAMKFLFSGGNGIIYAVNREGQLLFYRDVNQDGTGDVANPSVIGLGGWQAMKFLFSGGNGVLYAVDQSGRLLCYRDHNQDGTGDVHSPKTTGQSGWQKMKSLFSGGNGILYAVDLLGRLLFYRDINQDGNVDIHSPHVIGRGGWQFMKFLFSGGNGIIYAVDRFIITSKNSFEILGNLQVQPAVDDPCQAEVDAVLAAQNVVDGINTQISVLQTQLQHATPQQKAAIVAQIKQLDGKLVDATAALESARFALKICRDQVLFPSRS